ncbi:hypothetical protein APHAL10511_006621 [Amanita phalloides]|nr:hypothetical protein APHAL10511_006621 [Amanita phalloides]
MPTTRTSNKTVHPGLVDLSPSKHNKSGKENKKLTMQDNTALFEQRAGALERAALVIDENHHEDDAFDHRLLAVKTKALCTDDNMAKDGPSRFPNVRRINPPPTKISEHKPSYTENINIVEAPLTYDNMDIESIDSSLNSESSCSDDSTSEDGKKKVAKKVKKKAKKALKKAKKVAKKKAGCEDIKAICETKDSAIKCKGFDGQSQDGKLSKRAKVTNIDANHGLDPEWEKIVKHHADHSTMNKLMAGVNLDLADDVDSMAQYGSPIPDGQTDDIEAKAIKHDLTPCIMSAKSKKNKPYVNIKIEDNPLAMHKLKDICNGDDKWKLSHLGLDTQVQSLFMDGIASLAHMKAGSLDPLSNLDVHTVQAIVDRVYSTGKYEVTEDGPWLGLVTQQLQTWWNNIATKASEVIERFIKIDHKDELTTKELIAEQIQAHLKKEPIYIGSEIYMYVYQWAEWNDGVNSKGFGESALVLSTFANGHLTQLGQFNEDLGKEKLVGALILAMQAVLAEHLNNGRFVIDKDKPNHFSADNYGDIIKKNDSSKKALCICHATISIHSLCQLSDAQWATFIDNAHQHLFKPRTNKSQLHAISMASTLVEEEEEDDPDAKFNMDLD